MAEKTDWPEHTAVSLVSHVHTGLIRGARNPVLIGYCVESPLEVFKTAFPDYYVTRFNGYELFRVKILNQQLLC